jgi:TPR repeat protein
MGRVLEGRDRRLGRPVAIKELLSGDPVLRARFEREARITARLQHPAIVSVYEAGCWPGGEPFIAMRRVAGRALDAALAQAQTARARLSLLPNLLSVANAMAYAHAKGVVHRDLKPANVLIGDYGETVVIDWGLAKELGPQDEHAADANDGADSSVAPWVQPPPGATVAGQVLGTPMFMPPEQARGERVDRRADVYSLGAMLYYLVSGSPPFEAKGVEELLQKVKVSAPRPLDARRLGIAADLLAIVKKAMARDPRDRYPSAREMAEDLQRFQTGQLVAVHDYSAWQLVGRFVRRHAAILSVAGLALVALGTTGTVAFLKVVRARDTAQHDEADLAESKGTQELEDARAQRSQAYGYSISHRVKPDPDTELADARTLERQACDLGNHEGCRQLGVMESLGEGGPKDYAGALALLQPACDHGQANACGSLGVLYDQGLGVPVDEGHASQLYQKACDGGDAVGCRDLAVMAENGLGVPLDHDRALGLYRQACDGLDGEACADLGVRYQHGDGVPQDLTQARTLDQKACEGGDVGGCDGLGVLYQHALGVPQDLEQARALYETACNGGYPRGCFNLGVLYDQGEGVEQDSKKAAGLYQRACDGKDPDGCQNLGAAYALGQGVTQDDAAADAMFEKACDLGSGMGCGNLGEQTRDGIGVPQDAARAATLMQKACDGDVAVSCEDLGDLYRDGVGVPKDADKAAALFAEACEGGQSDACTGPASTATK